MTLLTIALTSEGTRDFLDRWGSAAEWGVALGTAALAAATFLLARSASAEAAQVRKQVETGQRPFVYPITPENWRQQEAGDGRLLQFKNGGLGPALNVRGRIYWEGRPPPRANADPIQRRASFVGSALASGDDDLISLAANVAVDDWTDVKGYLNYADAAGTTWRTPFNYREDLLGQIWADVGATTTEAEATEPAEPEGGWLVEEAANR